MPASRLPLLALVLAALCSCDGPGTDSNDGTFQVDTLASGLVQVVNDGSGVWTPETAWRLEEDLRIGTVSGGGPQQFSQVAWIMEDAEGRIYILDYPSQEVRIFGSEGEHSHTFGGQGEGPGELMSAAGLNWGPDGNLWVWGSNRFSVFTASGDFVTSYPRHTRGVIYPWNGGWTEDGRYFDWGLEFGTDRIRTSSLRTRPSIPSTSRRRTVTTRFPLSSWRPG